MSTAELIVAVVLVILLPYVVGAAVLTIVNFWRRW